MYLVLLILLILFCLGGLPQTGWHSYGYAPSGLVTVIIVIVLVMLLSGRD